MAFSNSLLAWLRTRTAVNCDTLEVEVAQELGPFEDCTSNQAIAYNELQKPEHQNLLRLSADTASRTIGDVEGMGFVCMTALAVEIAVGSTNRPSYKWLLT